MKLHPLSLKIMDEGVYKEGALVKDAKIKNYDLNKWFFNKKQTSKINMDQFKEVFNKDLPDVVRLSDGKEFEFK